VGRASGSGHAASLRHSSEPITKVPDLVRKPLSEALADGLS
jgi:hypothetical protein